MDNTHFSELKVITGRNAASIQYQASMYLFGSHITIFLSLKVTQRVSYNRRSKLGKIRCFQNFDQGEGGANSFWNTNGLIWWLLPWSSFCANISLVVSIIALASSVEIVTSSCILLSTFSTSLPNRWISEASMNPFRSWSINSNPIWAKLTERFLCNKAGCYQHVKRKNTNWNESVYCRRHHYTVIIIVSLVVLKYLFFRKLHHDHIKLTCTYRSYDL